MKKYYSLLIALTLCSCQGKKEIQLPKANKTMVADVQEHSPIYLFFEVQGKDTLVDLNRKNAIVSTNWIFNIDKRLSLRLVIPELQKLQAKKGDSPHKSDAAQNYFSYANSTTKTMAFVPFTKVKFRVGKPKSGTTVYFSKNNTVWVDAVALRKDSLKAYLNKLAPSKYHNLNFCFDKNTSFEAYLNDFILINALEIEPISSAQFVY